MKFKIKKIISSPVLYILIAAFIARIYFIIYPGIAWWDASIYIGMGKYFFSGGAVGVEELFRPILWPLILGFVWKLGLNPYYFGMVLDLALNLGAIFLTYVIAEKIINRKAAIFAAILLAISPTFIFYSSKVLTENLTVFIMLLAVYFFIDKKYSLAGFLAGITVLLRYPQGLLLFAFLGFIWLFTKDKTKQKLIDSAKTIICFSIPLATIAIYNIFAFGDILYQVREASERIRTSGMMLPEAWSFYLIAITLECFFAFLFLYSIYISWKEKNRKMLLIQIIFIIFFIYYSTVMRKEIRYLMVVLPMLYLSIGQVFDNIYYKRMFNRHIVKYVIFALIIIFAITSFYNIKSEHARFNRPAVPEVMENFFDSQLLQGSTIISSSPNPVVYADARVIPMEPSVYYSYLNQSADYYMFYSCDFFCADEECATDRATFINIIDRTKPLLYNNTVGFCSYLLYENI